MTLCWFVHGFFENMLHVILQYLYFNRWNSMAIFIASNSIIIFNVWIFLHYIQRPKIPLNRWTATHLGPNCTFLYLDFIVSNRTKGPIKNRHVCTPLCHVVNLQILFLQWMHTTPEVIKKHYIRAECNKLVVRNPYTSKLILFSTGCLHGGLFFLPPTISES